MICVQYNRAETLKYFALAAELLRESELTEDELRQLTVHEQQAIERITSFPDGHWIGDLICDGNPRTYIGAINKKILELTPSNMIGRLRLPERELLAILRRHKATGSPTWNQDYLRECERVAAERDADRIARWNARYPNHPVQ